jgi:RHS repeat-associated protein
MKRIPSVALGRHLLVIAGLALASTVGNLSAADTYYVSDHLATTTAVADAVGEIASLEADAFGSPVSGGEQAARYTGKPYDADIGAYVFPFRNYRSDEARWMSADPSGFPDGVNARLYVPNPFTQVDRLGLTVSFGSSTNTATGVTTTVSTAQQQQFHNTMQQIQNQGPEGQMLYNAVYGSSSNVIITNTPGEIPTGAGGLVNGVLTSVISLDFAQQSFVDPALAGSYVDQIGSAMSVLAHELGHGIYQFSDPENVVWENYFRPSDNQRTHYRDTLITQDMINRMRNRIASLVNPHME